MAEPSSPQHNPEASTINNTTTNTATPTRLNHSASDPEIESLGFRIYDLKIEYSTPLLLSLPPEILLQIYRYALLPALSRWETRHRTFCPHRDRTSISELPPFLTKVPCPEIDNPNRDACGRHGWWTVPQHHSACECVKRFEGIGLLGVSRRVNREASRVFWEEVRWGFDDGFEFVNFYDHIRQESRDMIQHVEIVGEGDWDQSSATGDPRTSGFHSGLIWRALMRLGNLKSLLIRHEHIEYQPHQVTALWTLRPHLTINFAVPSIAVIHYEAQIPKLQHAKFIVVRPLHKSTKQGIQNQEPGSFRHQIRTYWRESRVQTAREEVERQLMGVLKKRPSGLNTDLNPVVLGEAAGVYEGEVLVVGLPSSSRARYRMHKEEMMYEKRLKEAGKLTRAEAEVAKELAQRKTAKREEEQAKTLRRREYKLNNRERSRTSEGYNQRTAREMEKEIREKAEEKRVKETEVIRRTERKRDLNGRGIIKEEEQKEKEEEKNPEAEGRKRIWYTQELRRVERKSKWVETRPLRIWGLDKRGILEKNCMWWEEWRVGYDWDEEVEDDDVQTMQSVNRTKSKYYCRQK